MKIIDLLNKIANGEEVPKHVRYYNMIENIDDIMYVCKENIFCKLDTLQIHLNSRVEIIEEPQFTEEEIKEYTNKFLEVWTPIKQQFGKLFDELIRIKNDSGLNLEDNIKEEPQEHKIPEKLDIRQEKNIKNNWKWKVYGKEQSYNISTPQKIIAEKINEILDYLEE